MENYEATTEDYEEAINLCDLLSMAINDGFECVKNLKPGSEERSRAIKDVSELYRLKIEEEKMVFNDNQSEKELDLKIIQERGKKKDRILNVVTNILGLGLPMVFSTIWYYKGLKFEETGSITSSTNRSIISNGFRSIFKK